VTGIFSKVETHSPVDGSEIILKKATGIGHEVQELFVSHSYVLRAYIHWCH
jgi:hypothetical protein